MAQLLPLHIHRPGVAGLNPRDEEGILGPEWATDANNLVLSRKGRLQLRPGIRHLNHGNSAPPSALAPVRLFSHVNNNNYAYHYYHDGYRSIYVNDYGGGAPGGTGNWIQCGSLLVDGSANPAYSDSVKFQSFNGSVIVAGRNPNYPSYPGIFHRQTTPFAAFSPLTGAPVGTHDILAAFGRLWAINTYRLYWSNVLDPTTWGASDYIDLYSVFPDGADRPVAIAEYNGFLLVFGQRSIIVYEGADTVGATPSGMVKVEVIKGVGLIQRDLIQDVGDDLIFMSAGGLVSLRRVIQEKSMPINRIGDHVTESMFAHYSATTVFDENCTSAYDKRTGLMYIRTNTSYSADWDSLWVANVKLRNPDGSIPMTLIKCGDGTNDPVNFGTVRVANYIGQDPTQAGAMIIYVTGSAGGYTRYIGVLDPSISKDDMLYNRTGGTAIPRISFATGWMDFSEFQAGEFEKILKEVRLVVEGGNSVAFTLEVYGDYDDSTVLYTETVTADATAPTSKLVFDAGGECDVVKLKFTATGLSADTSITSVAVYAKRGKLSQ